MRKKYYRPDIDGLRAIAIITVVLFHADIPLFSGGYIGVDIFFVISGYLITSIIVRELRAGSFSLINFWERRVRRILPALVTMSLAVAAAGYIYLRYPLDVETLGKSVFSLGIFLSNIIFLRRDTYFDPAVESYPLLHTWSLAVEEQFYVVFPLLLLLLFTLARRYLFLILSTLAIASFAYSFYLVNLYPEMAYRLPFIAQSFWGGAENITAAFYLLPTRAWELLVGALLALSTLSIRRQAFAEIGSILGLTMIGIAVFFFDKHTAFPGLTAALPVLGSALLILANTRHKTFVSKLLSQRHLIWFGLISYSLYLWHWPIFTFAKTFVPELTGLQITSLILTSIYVAWLSYTYIEQPFIQKRVLASRMPLFMAGILSLLVLCLIGFALLKSDPTTRVPSYAQTIPATNESLGELYYQCYRNRGLPGLLKQGPCLIGAENVQSTPQFVLWGNSHAGAIVSSLSTVAKAYDVSGAAFIEAGCVPLQQLDYVIGGGNCVRFNQLTVDYLNQTPVKNIILVANWNGFLGDRGPESLIRYVGDKRDFSISNAQEALAQSFIDTLAAIKNIEERHIYVLLQPPIHPDFNAREIFYQSLRADRLIRSDTQTDKAYVSYNAFIRSTLETLQAAYPVTIIDPSSAFCASGICITYTEEQMLYKDYEHVNHYGAEKMRPLFETVMTEISKD